MRMYGTADAQQPRPAPVLRATTRIVYVDVVVRDGNGHIVRGLREQDFQIREDRQPQRANLFEEHSFQQAASATSGKPETLPQGELSNVPREAPDTSLNIVLLDLLNTSLLDQAYARKRMIEFLAHLPPGRQVGVMVLSNGVHLIQNFTTDSALLAKAAQSIDLKQPVQFRDPAQQNSDAELANYMDSQLTRAGGAGVGTGALLRRSIEGEEVSNTIDRLQATNEAFRQIALSVNGYPGRKNLFWLATQFPSSSYLDLRSISSAPRGSSGAGLSANPASAAFSETNGNRLPSTTALGLSTFSGRVDRTLADSQIAVYPISLLGVETDGAGAESRDGTGGAGLLAAFNARQTGREVMNHIADETGGEAFYGNNDPALLLGKALESGENYYTLAYQPQNHTWNGQFRRIQISLAGSGYHLSYRRGYFATPEQPPGNAMAQFASAVRAGTPPSTALVIRALTPGPPVGGDLKVQAVLEMTGVSFWLDEQGRHRARLQVRTIAYPQAAPAAPVESNAELNLGLTDEDYQAVLQKGVPVRQALHLPPGSYSVRLGALDLTSGRIGTLTFPYVMP